MRFTGWTILAVIPTDFTLTSLSVQEIKVWSFRNAIDDSHSCDTIKLGWTQERVT